MGSTVNDAPEMLVRKSGFGRLRIDPDIMLRSQKVFLVMALWPCTASAAEPAASANPEGFSEAVQPFLKEHCVKCHGPDKQNGKLRLDTLPADF